MWLVPRPSAGGKPPVWQVAHWFATTSWVWLKLDGRHEPPVRWQLSQLCEPTGTCVAVLPVAREPLWQVAQVPGETPLWSKPEAGVQAVVLWQLSHEPLVAMWLVLLPGAVLPLWQLAQLPGVTPVWLNC